MVHTEMPHAGNVDLGEADTISSLLGRQLSKKRSADAHAESPTHTYQHTSHLRRQTGQNNTKFALEVRVRASEDSRNRTIWAIT